MNWEDFGTAIALVLIIEGMLPFLSPRNLKQTYQRLLELNDGSIRWIGLGSMSAGLVLLYFIR